MHAGNDEKSDEIKKHTSMPFDIRFQLIQLCKMKMLLSATNFTFEFEKNQIV